MTAIHAEFPYTHDGRVSESWLNLFFAKRPDAQLSCTKDSKGRETLHAIIANQDFPPWAPNGPIMACIIGTTNVRAIVGDTTWVHYTAKPNSGCSNNLFWEWHNDGNLVKSTIAPHAAMVHSPGEMVKDNRLVPCADTHTPSYVLRVCGGLVPDAGGNQAYWHPNILIPGTQPVPYDKLMHFVQGYGFDRTNGWTELYNWLDGDTPPSLPSVKLTGVPTTVYTSRADDKLYPQWGNYGYTPGQIDQLAPSMWPTKEEAFKAAGVVAPPVVTWPEAKDNGDGTVTLTWTAINGIEEYVPTIDGSEYLTDGKRHPISPSQLSTKIAKPTDGAKHAYGIRANDRVKDGAVNL